METKIYKGITGGPGGFDGYAGLQLGKSYKGEEKEGQVVISLPNGRTTSVSPEQWREWFTFG